MKLRMFRANDAELVESWILDPAYANFFRNMSVVPTKDELRSYPQWTGQVAMMAEFDGNGITVGMATLLHTNYRNRTAHAAVLIDKQYQGQNCARETMLLWMQYIFNVLGFRKIIVEVVDEALKKPLLEFGFVEEGVHKAECYVEGNFVDEYRLAITQEVACSSIAKSAGAAAASTAASSSVPTEAAASTSGGL